MIETFNTRDVATVMSVDYWQESVSTKLVGSLCEVPRSGRFWGALDVAACGSTQMVSISAANHEVTRLIKSDLFDDDFFMLFLQCKGEMGVEVSGTEYRVRPGDFFLYDAYSPAYQLSFPGDYHHLILRLPRSKLVERLPLLKKLGAYHHVGGQNLSKLTAAAFMAFSANAAAMSPLERAVASDTIAEMFLNSVQIDISRSQWGQLSIGQLNILNRTIAFIRENLLATDLTGDKIAQEIGVSLRYINKIMASEGTSVRQYILSQRLDRAAQDLANPASAHRSVTEISYASGFNDLSYFSRTFKRHFGTTPHEYRKQACSCRD